MSPSRKVPVRLPNGAAIWVEVEPVGSREEDVVAMEGLGEALTIDGVREAIEGVAALVREAMEKAKPDKASVELGLELALESGKLTALWVKGTGKANLKVTLSWGK
jgi:hypothetical protein